MAVTVLPQCSFQRFSGRRRVVIAVLLDTEFYVVGTVQSKFGWEITARNF